MSEPNGNGTEVKAEDENEVLEKGRYLKKYFPIRRGVLKRTVGYVKAVDGISFDVYKGETLGLVGESGCGKSTAGRTILQLYEPTEGEVYLDGESLTDLRKSELRRTRRRMQMIFQDPYASLNPRMTVGNIISEPLAIQGIGNSASRKERVGELLDVVGLNRYFVNRYPHEFSGGQRQRIGVARALSTNPSIIFSDEPKSALDVSIQAQFVKMLDDLNAELGLTYLFIAHDLSMVQYISDRVAVMYLGRIVEMGERDEVYDQPLHPYTQALLSAIPVADPDSESARNRIILEGDVPSPANPPSGCHFHPRCGYATDICKQDDPQPRNLGSERRIHLVACHHADQFV